MEKLYNGIVLPAEWPPQGYPDRDLSELPVPYLDAPPDVIDIDIGRQLFVDDFLIEQTTLEKVFHSATYHPDSPVLRPETPLEMFGGIAPFAVPFTDGCWYDPQDGLYKLWYHAGWMDGTALAVSEDCIHWKRRMLEAVPGTNRIIAPPPGWRRDGAVIWLDQEAASPDERYKMMHYYRTPEGEHAEVAASRDGIHWGEAVRTGLCGDNSSFFYNPFRKKWVFSIRAGMPMFDRYCRARRYYECDDFLGQPNWQPGQDVFWQRCDRVDLTGCQPGTHYSELMPPQLYHVNAVAYESVMLGLFGIIKGFDEHDNRVCEGTGYPKHIDLHAAFSRDGFHFSRQDRAPFIACTDGEGDWNRGYLHACGGICLVSENQLMFPVGGFSGISPMYGRHLYAGGSTGIALLRRDGFASMRANWSRQFVTTRPVRFEQGHALFVNATADEGYVMAEILDVNGHALPGFTLDDCIPAQADATKQRILFKDKDLDSLQGQPIRFRFHVLKADLYAFWVSADARGASGGYVAAGGPSYPGPRDI